MNNSLSSPRLYCFVGGSSGRWTVLSQTTIAGESLSNVQRIDYVQGHFNQTIPDGWALHGTTSNSRYSTQSEKSQMAAIQAPLDRAECRFGALIPIRKNAAWWELTQDARRAIFEETSKHIAIGMRYLPGVARRLHHCRDMGWIEPFDFLTFFDFAEDQQSAFDDMAGLLRATEEWTYVDREVDLRLVRA
jgi:chlorite dismutase